MQCLSFTSYECNDEIDIPIAKRVLNNTGINCNEINIFTSSKVVIQTILLNLWLDNVPLFLRTTIGHEKSHYQTRSGSLSYCPQSADRGEDTNQIFCVYVTHVHTKEFVPRGLFF
jgi:hypothetical protein